MSYEQFGSFMNDRRDEIGENRSGGIGGALAGLVGGFVVGGLPGAALGGASGAAGGARAESWLRDRYSEDDEQ